MPFPDVKVFRENGKFATNICRKETFTGVYTNVSNLLPLEQKFGLNYNRCSNKFIENCISKFMNKLYLKKPVMLTVSKKQLYLVLIFFGKMSALVKSGLIRSFHKRLTFCKVKRVFKASNRLKDYFSFKDIVPEPLRYCQIYNFMC